MCNICQLHFYTFQAIFDTFVIYLFHSDSRLSDLYAICHSSTIYATPMSNLYDIYSKIYG